MISRQKKQTNKKYWSDKKMFKKITKEFLEENDINIAEDFPNMELERLLKKEFEDELEQN